MNWLFPRTVGGLLLASLVLTGCSDDSEEASPESVASPAASSSGATSPLLTYIPDATPYFLANKKRMSDEVLDMLWEMADPALAYAGQAITQELAKGAESSDGQPVDPVEKAFLEELNGKMSRQGLSELGLDLSGNIAIFGIGVLPVFRAEIADSSALEATIKRIEERAGTEFPKFSKDGIEYYESGDAEATAIVSVSGNQVVMGIVPTPAKEAALDQILGLEKPSRSLDDSGRLDDINKELGLLPFGTLYVDTIRLADAVMSDDSPLAAQLFSEQRANLTPECIAEFNGIAEVFPRLVSGYKAIDRTAIDQVAYADLRSDIAQGLKGLMVPMAGMDRDEQGLFNFGVAFDLLKSKQFLIDRAAAVSADPFVCPQLADLNKSMSEMQTQLSQPLPPMVGNIQGVRISVKDAEMAGGMPDPSNIKALLMVGMSNPQLIVGMASAFVPQLANLQIGTDGAPVPIPAGALPVPLDSPHVAMMNHGLAFSVGAGEQNNLKDFLDAEPPGQLQFMNMGYDAAAMKIYQEQMMQTFGAATGDPNMAQMPSLADKLERVSARVTFTDRGVEVFSSSKLKP